MAEGEDAALIGRVVEDILERYLDLLYRV